MKASKASTLLKLCMKSFMLVYFFGRGNWNSECPGEWQELVYIGLVGIGTPTQSHVNSNHNKSSERFQGSSVF